MQVVRPFPVESLGIAATSALPIADCGAAITVAGVAALDDPPGIHDGDAVGDGADHGEIVRNEQIGDVLVALQVEQQLEDLAAHRTSSADTASSSTISAGLVAMARAIATRWRWPPEISWMARSARSGVRPTRSSKAAMRARPLGAVGEAVDAQRIVEHAGHRGARIEGGQRILEHHLEARRARAAAPRRAARADRRRRSWIAPRVRLDQPHDEPRERRLAAAGWPDQRQRLAARDAKDDAVDRGDNGPAAAAEALAQAATSSSGGSCRHRSQQRRMRAPRCASSKRARVGIARAADDDLRVAPISTSRPCRNTAMRSAISEASAMSWLTNSSVMPSSVDQLSSSATISAWTIVSSALVGSSAISSFGPAAIAAAMATRCLWPPESWCG